MLCVFPECSFVAGVLLECCVCFLRVPLLQECYLNVVFPECCLNVAGTRNALGVVFMLPTYVTHFKDRVHIYIYNIYIYILAAYTRRCPANFNMKHYRSHSNFGMVGPLISFRQP